VVGKGVVQRKKDRKKLTEKNSHHSIQFQAVPIDPSKRAQPTGDGQAFHIILGAGETI
jgi:hypothetical protein